jgi:hypothetical protein
LNDGAGGATYYVQANGGLRNVTTQQESGRMPKSGAEFRENAKGFPLMRLALAVFFCFALWLVFWAVLLITAAQFIAYLFTREPSEHLRSFSDGLARYTDQTVGYLTFVHDDRPFPFGALPAA